MIVAFAIIMAIGLIGPFVIWWLRNVMRIIMKIEVQIISDNLKWIFIIGITIGLIFLLLLIMVAAKVF